MSVDIDAESRQRKRQQQAEYAQELESQMKNNQRRRQRDQLEQAERERREDEDIEREAVRPRRGGGGEPIRNVDGSQITALRLLKDAEGNVVGPNNLGGELLERTRGAPPGGPPIRDLIERTKPGAFGGSALSCELWRAIDSQRDWAGCRAAPHRRWRPRAAIPASAVEQRGRWPTHHAAAGLRAYPFEL